MTEEDKDNINKEDNVKVDERSTCMTKISLLNQKLVKALEQLQDNKEQSQAEGESSAI